MMHNLLNFRRFVGVLALIVVLSTGAGVGILAQGDFPVFIVDSSGEACQRPELVAYPCFRSIPAALEQARNSAVILLYAGEQPYPGFSIRSGLRALLIQGQIRRGETERPKISGTISLEGELQVILQDLILQGDPAISIGGSGQGPIFTRLQNLQVESKGTGVKLGQAGLVEIIDSVLCGGSCTTVQPGAGSGCGIELALNGRGILNVQSKQGLASIWGFTDGICTKGAQQGWVLSLVNTEIMFNAQHGLNIKGDPLKPENVFIQIYNSKIRFNGQDGVRLENFHGSIWNNQITFNGRHGIALEGGEVDVSYNNPIAWNADCGVLLLARVKVTGSGNKIFGNRRDLCGDFPPDFRQP
jgi:hypothetical protein